MAARSYGQTAPATPDGTAAASASSGTATTSATGTTRSGAGLAGIGFRVVPSFDIGETYNDNVRLAPKGLETSDFITTVTPSLDVTENASHFQGRLLYNPQALIFARGTSSDTVQQRLLGTGHARLYRDNLFLDGSASIQQAFVSNTGAIGPTTITSSGNLQTVKTLNASPYLLGHLSRYANSETRYRFTSVDTSGNQIAPEQTNEASQKFTGGEFFGRLGWTLTGDWTRINRGSAQHDPFSNTSSTDEFGRIDLSYPVYHSLSVIGGAGYERVEDPTLITQPKGLIWNVGLQYRPNQRLSASLTYGRRFQQTDIEFHASYALSAELRVFAIYTQEIQTSQSIIASNLGQVALAPNGTFINTQTGLPVTVNGTNVGAASSPFGITNGSFLNKRYEADVEATRGRNNYDFSAYNEKHSGSLSSSSNERIVGTRLSWGRHLWPNLSSTLSGAYSRSLFQDGSGRVDNLYSVSFSLSYAISPTASANLSATRYDNRSNSPRDSVIDDVITVSLHKQF